MSVSVIVPTFQGQGHVGELIAALVGQSGVEWELMVVDDGSTDATLAEVRAALAEADVEARVLEHGANRGKAAALNLGARHARSGKLIFLDQDDVPAPGYLVALADALDDHPFTCATVRVSRVNPAPAVDALFRAGADYFGIPFTGLEGRPVVVPVSMGGTLAIRSDALWQVGGFDERAGAADDLDLCLRLWLAGTPLLTVRDAVLDYRLRSTVAEALVQRVAYGRAWRRLYRTYSVTGMIGPPWRGSAKRVGRALVRVLAARPGALLGLAAELGMTTGMALGLPDEGDRAAQPPGAREPDLPAPLPDALASDVPPIRDSGATTDRR